MSYNPYTKLLGLLPQRPLQVGNVIAIDNGVCTIELPGGGRESARGEAAINDRVFFRDGLIEGPAPDLPFEDITV